MNRLNKLNPQQREAALHKDGPLLILAGAGSGKTSTIVHRIVHLIEDEDVSPYNILAVTFTNKAAGEMNERVVEMIGNRVATTDNGGRQFVRGLWIVTFHKFCSLVLKDHAHLLGFKHNFFICDPSEQKGVVKAGVKELGLDEKKYTTAFVLRVISNAKRMGMSAEEFLQNAGENPSQANLGHLYKSYMNTLAANDRMDFDDLIVNTCRLFEKFPAVLAQYRERFQYIMVDEYQDTDAMQNNLIRHLSEKHRNICVVGDDDQCIYTWRGADSSLILGFDKVFPEAKVIKLEENYRSKGNILGAANSVIANNALRRQKTLWTSRDDGEKVSYMLNYDEREEARYVARVISKEVSEGRNHSEFAVLYRTNAQSRTFEDAFSAFGIPYQVVGGVRYYDRKEIRDMMAYLRLADNPADDLSMLRVINEPKRGIGAKTLAKIVAYGQSMGMSIFECLLQDEIMETFSARTKKEVAEFLEAIEHFRMEGMEYRLSDIYDGLLVKSGYLNALEAQSTVEADGRIENLLEFKSIILEKESDNPAIGIAEFLDELSLVSDIDNHDRGADAVTMMTLHSAKGLEFPVVFLPGMEDGLLPSSQSMDRMDGIDEERRLCYVGMTRAEEKLYLLRAIRRTIYGKFTNTIESRFLREIDTKYLDGAEYLNKDVTGYFHSAMGGEDGFAEEPKVMRPFDNLKQIKEGVAKSYGSVSSNSSDSKFGNGDKVRHQNFGTGVVLASDERTVTVMFDAVGKKKLALGIAPLEKV
jgi:DNA helicase-2/ATP-dependent DNA helicase PcrA